MLASVWFSFWMVTPFLRLQRLVQPFGIAAALHHAAVNSSMMMSLSFLTM